MKINGLSDQHSAFINSQKNLSNEHRFERSKKIEEEAAASPVVETSAPVSSLENSDATEETHNAEKGVIRNLLEGHFKGVADVRLRINFFEELQQLQFQAENEVVQAELESLIGSIDSELDKFVETDEIDEEQVDAIAQFRADFADRITAIAEQSAANTLNSEETLFERAQSAFDSLLASLRSLFEIPSDQNVEANPADGENETSASVDSSQSPAESFIENLNSVFSEAFNKLNSSVAATSVLPELSPAEGNGRAYDKFLAIYRDLSGTQTEAQEPAEQLLTATA